MRIILTMHDEPAMVQRVMDLGADGYLVNCGRMSLLAIRDVHLPAGGISAVPCWRVARASEGGRVRAGALKDLSEREQEVLAALAEGLTNKEMASGSSSATHSGYASDQPHEEAGRAQCGHGLVRLAIKAGL